MGSPRRFSCLLACLCVLLGVSSAEPRDDAPRAQRIVSMNPSLTSILIDLGAAASLVGVEEQSLRLHPEVADLPAVGGLFNPSLEAVVALEPDLVVLVPSAQQRSFRERLTSLDVEVLVLPNIRFDEILASIEVLGARVGRGEAARQRIETIRRVRAEVERQASGSRPLRTVIVVQRDPLYVVGPGSYIDEMLRAAGGENTAAAFTDPYPRAAVEWLIDTAPDVILDATGELPSAARYWSRWPSIPAVANDRVRAVDPALVTMPGPHLDLGLRALADALHPNDREELER